MKEKLLFVTDLGCFKAYRVQSDNFSSRPKLSMIDSFYPLKPRTRLSEQVTDSAGQFAGGVPGVHVVGERHNISLEQNRRVVQQLAGRINEIARKQSDLEHIYIAAHRSINQQLLERLQPDVRARVERNIGEDLTKVHESELLGYFNHTAPV